jgi:hypothetical protein
MIPRYARSTFEDERTYDIIYTDRLTGTVVMRYDGADPANTNPAYGAKSDSEYLASRGHDINAEIEASQSVLPVPAGEAERLANRKKRRAEVEGEENNALELMAFLGGDADQFNFDDYFEGERDILGPALEKRGYTRVSFYMIEQDSFGPLIRGVRATCHCGKRVRFFYG